MFLFVKRHLFGLLHVQYTVRVRSELSSQRAETIVITAAKHSVNHQIIINIRGQIENRPLENTRFAGRK